MRIDAAHLRKRKRTKKSKLENSILKALQEKEIKTSEPFDAIEQSDGVWDIVIGKERFAIEIKG